jgi:prophage regulatory protein
MDREAPDKAKTGAFRMVRQLQIALVILRLRQVEQKVGLKSSSIYQKISEGVFPSQVRLGARAVGWIESEIDAWIAAQVEKSRAIPHAEVVRVDEKMPVLTEAQAAPETLPHKILPQPGSTPKPRLPAPYAKARSGLDSTVTSSEKRRRT